MTLKTMIRPSGDVFSVNSSTNFVDGKDYYFYDKNLTSKLPMLYPQLLGKAKDHIVIWDPHYQYSCQRLFCDVKNDGVVVEILTICQGLESKKDIMKYANTILSSIDKNAVPNCSVTVNALKRDWAERHTFAADWHDRYLIVDGDVYLVGTSMDAQADKSFSFGIKRVSEDRDKNLLIDTYITYRNKVVDESAPNGNGFKCTAKRGYV